MTGRNQSTIHRAMKTGRLSYTVSETGERRIDTSELERVFGLKLPGRGNGEASTPALAHAVQSHSAQAGEIAALERLLAEREATIARQDEAIRDLRTRLDAEAEERRRVQARLTGLLTYRQAGSVPAVKKTEVPWWRRWFRG
jgi:hypothetical protein